MVKFRKTRGVVTGLLAAALAVSAIGVAQAATVNADASIVVKVGTDFPLYDTASANNCNNTDNGNGNDCVWTTTQPEGITITDPDPLDKSFTYNAATVGTFTIVISGARGNVKDYETTWTVYVVPGNIVDVAVASPEFETLVAAVAAAELVDALRADGPFTVFAPTDAAFAALPSGVLAALLLPENKGLLTRILLHHVVADEILSGEIPEGVDTPVQTLDEVAPMVFGEVVVHRVGDAVTVDVNKNVVIANVLATNGVVHAIDGVLVPADLADEIAALETVPGPGPGPGPGAPAEAKKYTVTVTGYAYKKTGNSTLDERRSAAVSSYLQSLGLDSTNSTYSEVGTELRKNTRSARSAVVSVTYMKDGASVTVKKRIYFTAKKSTLSKSSKAKLNAFVSSVK